MGDDTDQSERSMDVIHGRMDQSYERIEVSLQNLFHNVGCCYLLLAASPVSLPSSFVQAPLRRCSVRSGPSSQSKIPCTGVESKGYVREVSCTT